MITVDAPGWGSFPIRHLLLDLNGTLALDGVFIPGVEERILELSEKLDIHILTADTFGTAARICHGLPVTLHVIPERDQIQAKGKYLNGLPLALGIAVMGPEGTSSEAVRAADVVVMSINEALDLLLHPERLKATLRS
jgi:soluble P-type ATPase